MSMSKTSSIPPQLNLTSTITKPSFQDPPLPESVLIASEIMKQSILKQLYLYIYEKKNLETHPNFDLDLKPIQSSSSIQIPLVTVAIECQKLVVFGDRMGGIYLYDSHKKMVLSKKEVSVGRKITQLAAESIVVGDVVVCTIAVIAKGDPNVYVYRYKSNQEKLFLAFQLEVSKKALNSVKEGDDISDFPCEVKLSKYALLAAVSLYNGNVVLYSIPELRIVAEPKQKVASNTGITPHPNINLDEPLVKLQNHNAIIEFKGEKKRKTYKETIQSLKKPVVEVPVVQKQEKKKEPPKGKQDKKDPKAVPVAEQKKEEPKPLQRQFNEPVLSPLTIVEESKDYSVDPPAPKYKAHFYFINDYICVPGPKQFCSIKSVGVTTKLFVCWSNTSQFSFFSLYSLLPHNIPANLYAALYHTELKKEKDSLDPKLVESIKTIYPITSTAVSEDISLLTLGLRDGTVQVWDMSTGVLKHNFNKHPSQVRMLSFFEVYKIISGGQDGSVLIHDLQKGQTVQERTNVFESKEKYRIIEIRISSIGVAFVLDSLGNVKIYDLWRNEKVGVLIASPPKNHTNKYRVWNTETPTMLVVSDNLLILSDNVGENQSNLQKSTVVQCFKIFESLLSMFDALSVLYRKGIDRQKVINIFSNLKMNQLYQKTFQLPESHHEERNFKKHTHTHASKGLETISEVGGTRNAPNIDKKKKVEILEPEIAMFSRRKTPKVNLHNEEWLINGIREQHAKKDMRENRLLGVSSKTEHSFNA